MRKPTLGLILAILLCAVRTAAAPAPSHPAEVVIGDDTFADPYSWMQAQGLDYLEWIHDQDALTRRTLSAAPGYAALAAQVDAMSDADPHVSNVEIVGDQVYYEREDRGEAQASLYGRALAGGPERRLVDPVAIGDATTSIHEYAVSPDNRRLAVCLAGGGSEEAVLQVMGIASGETLPERIDRARAAGPVWSEDDSALFYTRLKATYSGPSDRFSDETIFRHRPGEDPARDVALFTADGAGSELGRAAFIGIVLPPGSAYALAFANSGVSKKAEWFAAPAAELFLDSPHWQRVAALSDRIVLTLDGNTSVQPVIRGAQAWFPSLGDAERGRVVRIDLDHPGADHEVVVVPQQDARLAGVAGTKDGLYLAYASGSSYTLARTGYEGGTPTDVALPYEGTIKDLGADPRQSAAVVGLESWARPASHFLADATDVRDLHLAPPFALDLSDIVTKTVLATAQDGVRIPVSVSHRRDLGRDGSAPTLAEAYGAYGFSYDPVFHPEVMPFLRAGGVWAVAHVRGGGEFGEAWHQAGMGATKPNTWRDFIASVEALEADGFTSPGKVVGFGASAGGIMIGRTLTERPDLLAGAVMWAPTTNMLRMETTEGGPQNVAEFGSVGTHEGYVNLRAMDAYSHVVDGTDYPAGLISVGRNAPRGPGGMGAEMAARLQAASRSGKPVLLRVDDQGGHHVMGASRADMNSQITDMLAFVLQQAGDPAFQPHAAQPDR